jgi:hypothetical protein
VFEEGWGDAGADAFGPGFVQLVDVEGGDVVEEHAEGEEGLHRHRIQAGRIGNRVLHVGETAADEIADLGITAGSKALQLEQERGAVRQQFVVLPA